MVLLKPLGLHQKLIVSCCGPLLYSWSQWQDLWRTQGDHRSGSSSGSTGAARPPTWASAVAKASGIGHTIPSVLWNEAWHSMGGGRTSASGEKPALGAAIVDLAGAVVWLGPPLLGVMFITTTTEINFTLLHWLLNPIPCAYIMQLH